MGKTTGELQNELAAVITEYAAKLSHGELRAALRLGKPDVFEQTCMFCGGKLEVAFVCPTADCPLHQP